MPKSRHNGFPQCLSGQSNPPDFFYIHHNQNSHPAFCPKSLHNISPPCNICESYLQIKVPCIHHYKNNHRAFCLKLFHNHPAPCLIEQSNPRKMSVAYARNNVVIEFSVRHLSTIIPGHVLFYWPTESPKNVLAFTKTKILNAFSVRNLSTLIPRYVLLTNQLHRVMTMTNTTTKIAIEFSVRNVSTIIPVMYYWSIKSAGKCFLQTQQ